MQNYCKLCGEPISNKYTYCRECYYDIQSRMDEIYINQDPFEPININVEKLKDYYYNAKDYAMRIFDEDKIFYQKLNMIAITNLLNNNYNDNSLIERLHKDIAKIDENFSTKNNKKITEIIEIKIDDTITPNNDKQKIKKTQDGHLVKSEFEIKVDDILYNNNIVHAYNIKVDEITERTVMCDWFIPVLTDKGIFIELWGVKGDEKYNKNKKEKIELYKKHNLKLIEIEYDELKNNTQRLKSSIKSKINIYKDEIFKQLKN